MFEESTNELPQVELTICTLKKRRTPRLYTKTPPPTTICNAAQLTQSAQMLERMFEKSTNVRPQV